MIEGGVGGGVGSSIHPRSWVKQEGSASPSPWSAVHWRQNYSRQSDIQSGGGERMRPMMPKSQQRARRNKNWRQSQGLLRRGDAEHVEDGGDQSGP